MSNEQARVGLPPESERYRLSNILCPRGIGTYLANLKKALYSRVSVRPLLTPTPQVNDRR